MGSDIGGSFWAYVKFDVWLSESKLKKKPLPSLSSRKGLTNWRFLLKNNKVLCASYFNFQCSIFNSIDYNAPADAPLRNKRKGYQPIPIWC